MSAHRKELQTLVSKALFAAETQCNFFRAEVATSQEFRTNSKLDAILRRFLTKLHHKGPLGIGGFVTQVSVCFCMVMANTDEKRCIRLCLRLR